MPHHSIRIIHKRRRDSHVRMLLKLHLVFRRRNHVRFDIEAVEREVDGRVHLLHTLVPAGREAFEMHDQELGRAGDDDLLRGFALAFAVRAFPHLVFAQSLFLAVGAQAVVDICALALLRDLDADAVEGFVGGGGVLAGGAAEAAGVLAGEEVGDEGGFAVRVALPFDLGDFLDGHAFAGEFLLDAQRGEGRFLPPLVEVFVQAVEEEVEVLFGVLLPIGAPFGVQTGAEVADGDRADGLHVASPEGADEVGVDFGHDSIGAFPVLDGEVAPAVVEEELGKGDGREEALDGSVHITGAAEVYEAGTGELEVMGYASRGVKWWLCSWA